MNKVDAPALPYGLLQLLLRAKGLEFGADDFRAAITDVAAMGDTTPLQKVEQVAKRLTSRAVDVGQTPWWSFNRELLPALVFINDEWCLAETTSSDSVAFRRASNAPDAVVEMNFSDVPLCVVVWVRLGETSTPASASAVAANDRKPTGWSIIFKSLFSDYAWVADAAIATVVVNALALATSLFAMQVYDRVVPTLAYSTLYSLFVGILLIALIDWILKVLRAQIVDRVSCKADKEVSQELFDQVLNIRADRFPKKLGALASQVSGLDGPRQFFSSAVVFSIVDLPFALLFLGLIAVIGHEVALIYAGMLVVSLLFGYFAQKRVQGLVKKNIVLSNERLGLLVEAARGHETLKTNGVGWQYAKQWGEISASIASYNLEQKRITTQASVTSGSIGQLAYAGAVVLGVHLIEAGTMTMGAMIACSILGGRVLGPVGQVVSYLIQWESIRQSVSFVSQLFQIERQRKSDSQLLIPDQAPQSVELKELSYSYDESPVKQLNIQDLSFSAGERVAILGKVGSGKSTLLKILAGLYHPKEGRTLLGGVDIWELDPNYLWRHVAYLSQTAELFKGTLRSNLTFGASRGDTEVLTVSQQLGIDQIAASHQKGMDLEIAEGGLGLSGGQRQLIALGRVMLKQPTLWLLDEPTASLDSSSQQQVIDSLKRNFKRQDILIFATHNPQLAMELATRVIIMDGGQVVKDVPAGQVQLRSGKAA